MMKLFVMTAMAALSLSAPTLAQETKEAKAEATEMNNANDVAITITNKMITLFSLIPNIKDESDVNDFTKKANALGLEITKLNNKIKDFPKPNDNELKEYAQHSVEVEKKLSHAMQAMVVFMRSPKNQLLAQQLEAGMAVVGQAAQNHAPIREEYYPAEKLKPLIDKIKADR